MLHSRKNLAFILILCMILNFSSIFSCGKAKDEKTDTPTDIQGITEEVTQGITQDPRMAVSDDLPEKDYGEYEFTILYPEWSMYAFGYYFADEEIGEKFSDSLYFRQQHVEERFNIKIKNQNLGHGNDDINLIAGAVKKSVLAGDDAYDMVLTHCISGLPEMSTAGLVIDFNKLPGINLSKPWWNQKMNQTLSVGGALPFAVSDYIVPEPNVIYFNKKLLSDFSLEDPYKLVKDGKWTLDKFTEMARTVSQDVDGNGVYDEKDQYGLVAENDWMMISFMYSSEQYCVEQKEGEPYPKLAMNTPKMVSIVEKVYNLLFEGNQTFTFAYRPDNIWPLDFDSGRALFVIKPLNSAIKYRSVDVDFGILPFPKYDENQQNYVNNSWNGFMCVPSVASDPERNGIIIEALSAESYKYCVPAYYDVLLTTKLSRDEQSSEMLNIIYNSCSYDSGLCFSQFNNVLYSIPHLMAAKSKDFVSFYEKNSPAMEKALNKTYEAIIEKYGS